MKMVVFYHFAPCSLIDTDRRFRGAYCPHHQVGKCVARGKVCVDKEAGWTRQRPNKREREEEVNRARKPTAHGHREEREREIHGNKKEQMNISKMKYKQRRKIK
jgi:hypothetical protein